jgi:hypothetical protein
MRSTCTFLLLCLTTFAVAQQTTPPKLSATPLTTDQIAIYSAFLADYQSGSKTSLNVANTTEPFQPDTDPMLSDSKNDRDSCLRSFPAHVSATEIHLLPDVLTNVHVRLVDPAKHKIADPGDSIRRPQDVDAAVEAGFAAALMTLSEIVFDTQHGFAAFSYSFVCGRLCGNGGTVIYERHNGGWKRSARRCSSWIS